MRRSIRAHYDGKFIVPDEPLDIPVNLPLRVDLSPINSEIDCLDRQMIENRRARLRKALGGLSGPALEPEALRREVIYDDRA
jgi:hypothetical protein